MKRSSNAAISFTLVAVAAVGASSAVQGAPGSLPSVQTIHARFAKALGGTSAIQRPRSMITFGHYDVVDRKGKVRKISFVRYSAQFRQLEIDTDPVRGLSRSGYDDGVAWGINPYPQASPQIAKGALLQSARRDADIYYFAHISDYFSGEDVVGIEAFAGHTCYHVRGITKWGNENNQYFDTQTGLLVGYGFHQWNAAGTGRESTVTRQVFDDYRNFDGLLIPMRISTFDGGRFLAREQDTAVQFDDVDDRVFTLPPSVVAALRKRG
jgi:hypothetical protein